MDPVFRKVRFDELYTKNCEEDHELDENGQFEHEEYRIKLSF